jgi:hypothetical protein
MLLATAETHWSGLKVVAESGRKPDQKHRIIQAIGLLGGHLPRVDERTHSQYYEYLSAKLLLPFAAYYPKPRNSQEEDEFRCTVLELLDPKKHVGDGVDGIFCKTRKGKYEVNLPLIELDFPHNSPNFQFIEDYWYWFWNWR